MANEGPDEILLTIKVSKEEVEKNVLAARAALVQLKAELKATQKEYDKKIITAQEYAKSEQAITTQMEKANATIREGKKTLAEYAKAEKEAQAVMDGLKNSMKAQGDETAELQKRISDLAAGFANQAGDAKNAGSSMGALDKSIAQLKEEYDGLTKAQRDNKDIGGVLLNQINALERTQDKNNKTVEQSKKGVREYIRDVSVLGVNVGSTIDSFRSGGQGALTFAKAIFTSRGALIALTAVPIVLVLTALVTLLTKSQKGMDFLAQATGAVSAVFSLLTQKVIAVGSVIVGLFTNTKQTLTNLGNFIEQNLINRFKAFGVILEAIKSGDLSKITDGFVQLGTGVTNATAKAKNFTDEIGKAAKAGIDMAKAAQAIEEAEIALDVQRGKSLVTIEKNKQISEDTTKSAATRVTAAKKAYAEEEKLQKSEQALQLKRIKLAQEEAKANGNLRADRKKVAEEQAKYEEIAANAIGRRTEIQNNINSINAEAEAKALENARKAAQERVNEAEIAVIVAKRRGEDTIQIEQEVYKRTLELIRRRRDAELVGVKKGSQERKAIIERANTEELEAAKELALKTADIVFKAKNSEIETNLAFTRKGSQEELELRVKSINAEKNRQIAIARATIKDKQKLFEEEERLTAVAGRQLGDLRQSFAEADVNHAAEMNERRLQAQYDLSQKTLEDENKLASARIDLEEQTQTDLLKIQEQYGQLAEGEYLNRLNAIQAKAIAARKAQAKKEEAEARASRTQIAGIEESIAREGSKAQLQATLNRLKEERAVALEAANGNAELIQATNKYYDDLELKARRAHNQKVFEMVVEVANQAITALNSIIDAQANAQISALERQQEAMLSSAVLSADARTALEEKYAKKREEIENAANDKKKKAATAENLINSAVAITKAFRDLGPIGGAIATAFIVAQAAAQQIVIDNQKFADGGYVVGPSHAQGGVKYRVGNRMIELEGGEAIINKRSTQKHYDTLSKINQEGGGVAFPNASRSQALTYSKGLSIPKYSGPVYTTEHATPKFAYGGFNAGIDSGAIAAAVIDGLKGANFRVGVDAITRAQNEATYAASTGDITFKRTGK